MGKSFRRLCKERLGRRRRRKTIRGWGVALGSWAVAALPGVLPGRALKPSPAGTALLRPARKRSEWLGLPEDSLFRKHCF